MKGIRITGSHGAFQFDQSSSLMLRSLDEFMTYTADGTGSARAAIGLPAGPFFMVSPNVFPLRLSNCRMENISGAPTFRIPSWFQDAGASTSALSLRLFRSAGPDFDYSEYDYSVGSDYGLRIKRPDGKVAFDSRYRYMRVMRIAELPPALPFNPTSGEQIAFRDSFVASQSTTYIHNYSWPELAGQRLWFNFECLGAIAIGSNAGMTKIFHREVVFNSATSLTFYCRSYVYGNPFGPGLDTPSQIFPCIPNPTYLLTCGD